MCMDVRVMAQNGQRVSARSMEFGVDLLTQVWQRKGKGTWTVSMQPSTEMGKADQVDLVAPNSENQTIQPYEFTASWQGNYDFIHTNALCNSEEMGRKTANGYVASDGMNTQGLSIGSLYLPGMTYYLTPAQVKKAQADSTDSAFVIGSAFFPTWVLSSFSSVEALVNYLSENPVYVLLSQLGLEGENAVAMTLHYVIHDADGQSAVIEFLYDRKMHIHRCYAAREQFDSIGTDICDPYVDNFKVRRFSPCSAYEVLVDHAYIGVMTNSSDYIWHVNYLSQFSNLTNKVQQASQVNHTLPIRSCWSPGPLTNVNGSGLIGLPADPTPPSRFVQTYVCQQLANRPKTINEAMTLAEKLLNRIDIPRGLVVPEALKNNEPLNSDITQWAVLRDHESRALYFRSYANMTWEKAVFLDIDRDVLLKSFSLTETAFESSPVLTPIGEHRVVAKRVEVA
ncbi:linear amide C-N hydrolase [Salinivibrio proteolyticus]|uniref:linear amide C-N hydrolase n=1 Tax=Salinivibrio proteolyticus TaxID=334715 RepID=UPI0009892439|nr:linear amide C-N hydrolase [Salinivibrio proteolyticus]